ncbi:hypothetical protein [Radiobacillus sp. PE A8.2]|uniref:hypothetical protein n=1 Tax=Radiobacillus sp. PE A8.2 TaxID=3380349 RepID=UPI00388E57D7
MNDKQFDEKIGKLKHQYNHLPTFRTDDEIAKGVLQQTKKTRNNWTQRIPYASAITVAVIIFTVLTFAQIQRNQVDEKLEPPTDEELQSWDLEERFEFRLQQFQQSLGTSNTDSFYEVKQAELLLDKYKDSKDEEELGTATSSIYAVLTTPKMKLESMNQMSTSNSTISDHYTLKELIGKLETFQYSVEQYWQAVVDENELSDNVIADYVEQYNADGNIVGPPDIQQALELLDNQGYRLHVDVTDAASVQLDFDWIKTNLKDEWLTGELVGYLNILSLTRDDGLRKENHLEVILAIERQFVAFSDNHITYQRELSQDAMDYLNDLFTGGLMQGERMAEQRKQEIEQFINDHEESLFYPMVHKLVEQYQANDWLNPFSQNQEPVSLDLVMNILEDRTAYEAVYVESMLQLDQQLQALYEQYSQTHDDQLLKGLTPFQIMQFYMIASEDNDFETYYALLMKEAPYDLPEKESLRADYGDFGLADYWGLDARTNYVLQTRNDAGVDRGVVLWFKTDNNEDAEERMAFQVKQRKDGIWKVPFMPIQ